MGRRGRASQAFYRYISGVNLGRQRCYNGYLRYSAGNLYVADSSSNVIRKVDAKTQLITTVAGLYGLCPFGYTIGHMGDGGPATSAALNTPTALAVDSTDNIDVVDFWAGCIRKITATNGIITTVVGNGNRYGTSGDGGPATSAEIYPSNIAFDAADNLFLSDGPVIRKVTKSTGIITRVVGNGYPSFSGDGGSPIVAGIEWPTGIAFDAAGSLYIADSGNYRVRKVAVPTAAQAPVFSLSTGTYSGVQTVTMQLTARPSITPPTEPHQRSPPMCTRGRSLSLQHRLSKLSQPRSVTPRAR